MKVTNAPKLRKPAKADHQHDHYLVHSVHRTEVSFLHQPIPTTWWQRHASTQQIGLDANID
jgi:hypothetical protein